MTPLTPEIARAVGTALEQLATKKSSGSFADVYDHFTTLCMEQGGSITVPRNDGKWQHSHQVEVTLFGIYAQGRTAEEAIARWASVAACAVSAAIQPAPINQADADRTANSRWLAKNHWFVV